MTSASTVRRQAACTMRDGKLHVARPSPSIGATFWTLAIGGWLATGDSYWLFNFSYIGTSVTLGMGLYSALVKPNKPWSRWCSWACRTAIVLDLLRFECDRAGRLVRLSFGQDCGRDDLCWTRTTARVV